MYVKGGNWFTQARRYEISASVGSNARAIATDTEECGRRAKESQDIARKAEEEAKEEAEYYYDGLNFGDDGEAQDQRFLENDNFY